MRSLSIILGLLCFLVATLIFTLLRADNYFLFATYPILQALVLAVGWNILGGGVGYVNFGAAGFFGVGVYTAAVLINKVDLPIIIISSICAGVGALLGLVIGGLSIRIKGVFFAIATLAMTVIAEVIVLNIPLFGGARGLVIKEIPYPSFLSGHAQYSFLCLGVIAIVAILISVYIEHSTYGFSLKAIRDDEVAAANSGIPVLRYKVIAAGISGAILAAAGSSLPLYMPFIEPMAIFDIGISLKALAMPVIGGIHSWIGPIVGALIIGGLEHVTGTFLSGAWSLITLGLLIIVVVIVIPQGLVGLVKRLKNR